MKTLQLSVFLFMAYLLGAPLQAATASELASEFQTILDTQAFAHEGQGVNYLKLADNITGLKAHVDKYAKLSIAGMGDNDKKAAYFNLYNAATLYAITKNLGGKLGSKKGAARQNAYVSWAKNTKMLGGLFGAVKPWTTSVKLAGVKLTIDQIEHGLLRKDAKKAPHKKAWDALVVDKLDARLHVAVNCGAKDCPPISKKAYTKGNIDSILNSSMTSFLRNKFSIKNGQMHGSSIVFSWYLADFVTAAGGADKVGLHLSKYLEPVVKSPKAKALVDFFKANPTIITAKYKHSYNWLVNDRHNY